MSDSAQPHTDHSERAVYCVWCLRSHTPPVAVAVNDGCPSQPDLMAALESSLVAHDEEQVDDPIAAEQDAENDAWAEDVRRDALATRDEQAGGS